MASKTKRKRKKTVKKMTTGRTTTTVQITVPNEIRRRMIEFHSSHAVNWSQIASSAFEQWMEDHEE